MSDLYFQVADNRPVRQLEDRIVMLDIGQSNRAEIAEVLSLVSLCDPKAVALDINFELPGEDDQPLLEALGSIPELFLPLGVEMKGDKFEISDRPFFYESLKGPKYGVINFPSSGAGGTIREYATHFPMTDGGELPSLAMAIAKATYPQNIDDRNFNSQEGIIAYQSKELKIIPASDLADRAEELIGKIVIIGTTTEAGDVYATPLRRGISGMEIHAYSLSTILDGTWMRALSPGISNATAIILCYLIVLGAIGIRSGIRGLLIRIAQIASLYFLVRIGYGLLVDHGTVADFSQAILMITFGLLSVDLWNGTVALAGGVGRFVRKRKEAKAKEEDTGYSIKLK